MVLTAWRLFLLTVPVIRFRAEGTKVAFVSVDVTRMETKRAHNVTMGIDAARWPMVCAE